MSERMARLNADADRYAELDTLEGVLTQEQSDILYLVRVKRLMELFFEIPGLVALEREMGEDGTTDTSEANS